MSLAEISAGVASARMRIRGGMRHGDLPVFSWNGEKPVDAFMVFMMVKHTRGS